MASYYRYKKTAIRLLLIISSVFLFLSCVTPNPAIRVKHDAEDINLAKRAFRTPIVKPYLWEVTSKDNKISYLFGTMHIGISLNSDIPLLVWKKFNKMPTFIMESDPEGQLQVTEDDLKQIIEKGIYSEQIDLQSSLGKEAWEKLNGRVKMPANYLRHYRPDIAYGLYLNPSLYSNLIVPSKSLDLELYHEAKKSKKEVLFLEEQRVVIQILLNKSNDEITIDKLRDLILKDEEKFIRKERKDYYRNIYNYRRGTDKSMKLLLGNLSEEDYGILISRRNKEWMKSLKTQLEKGGCFVAVGVGHMLGIDSLLKLLKENGFKVRRMTTYDI